MKRLWMLLTLILIASGLALAQDQAPPPDPPEAAQPADPAEPPAPMPMQRGFRDGPGMPGTGMGMRMGGPGMGMRGPGPGKWWKNPELAQKIGLTDDQISKMEKIFQDSRLKLIDLHATLEKQEAILEPLVQADHPDENRVLAQIDQVAQARAELEKANARMLLGIRNVLTPEQWKQLKEMRAANKMRRREDRPFVRQRMRFRQTPGAPGASAPPAPPSTPNPQD
jgi:periplasmic protein CpxP/Spy